MAGNCGDDPRKVSFVWGNDATIMMGTTPTGRATIEELKLNRAPVMNLRRVLVDAGLHPPPEPA
jgi:hypothetical protein